MNKSFIVKDLRNTGGTTIDLVAKHKKKNFSLFFKVTEETREACLCGFEGDGFFRKLVIPDTLLDYQVTRIGQSALECCEIASVVVSPTVNAIDDFAFSGCFALKNIELPETIVSIGEGAFQNCENLRKISLPNSLLKIGEDAFSGCSSLSEIIIPKTVVSIGREAFWGCKGLTSIAVHNDNKVYDSREDCNAVISTADDRMVVGCTKTVIPNSVRIIEYAFAGQSDLEFVTIPTSVVVIGDGAFRCCKELREIAIPNSVKRIGKGAFEYCSNLKEISTPRSVIEIESRAFGGCENLSNVTIPRSVKSIAITAFEDCPRLLPYPIDGGNPYYIHKNDRNVLDRLGTAEERLFIHISKQLDQLCLSSSFDDVVKYVFDEARPSGLENFNEVFFKAMKYYTKELFDLGYVRFLNVFNDIPASDKGSVGYFADFVHFGRDNEKKRYDVVTNQKRMVDIGENNLLFHDSALLLDKLLSDSCAFRKSFEYCCKEQKPLLSDGFTEYKDSVSHGYKDRRFGEWLQSLETCYDEKDNGVTNYCLLLGSPAYYGNNGALDKTLRKAVVRAVVGIDCRKEDRNIITQFLKEFQGFLEQMSFNLIVDLARENNKR